MATIDEDYWTTSKSSHSNFFDDDEESTSEFLFSKDKDDSVFHSQVEETNTLRIDKIISKKCLSLVLDDINTLSQNVIPPVEETVRRICNGQKFVLCMYRSLKDKLLLLDYALNTWDGYIILCVLDYLRRTLKPQLFYYHLTKKKMAVRQYANYLITNRKLQELEDFYMATGNISNLDEIYYISCRSITNKQNLYKLVDKTSQTVNSSKKQWEINQYKQLLQWQIEKHKEAESLIEQLAHLIKEELEKNRSTFEEDIVNFKKTFNISDYQYEWTLLNTLSAMGVWPKLVSIFVKSNWFSKKSGLKTVIEQTLFVQTLNKHDPPKNVIEEILQCMSDQKEAYNLAERLKCHKFLINYFVSNKDRLALISYKNKVPAQSEEYFLIENALHSSDKRWKN